MKQTGNIRCQVRVVGTLSGGLKAGSLFFFFFFLLLLLFLLFPFLLVLVFVLVLVVLVLVLYLQVTNENLTTEDDQLFFFTRGGGRRLDCPVSDGLRLCGDLNNEVTLCPRIAGRETSAD